MKDKKINIQTGSNNNKSEEKNYYSLNLQNKLVINHDKQKTIELPVEESCLMYILFSSAGFYWFINW